MHTMSRKVPAHVGSSQSSRKCCFCGTEDDNELEYGKFYEYDGIVTHYYCLLLSSNMQQKGDDNEGILGFLPDDIYKELKRGRKLTCFYCRKVGATLGCCNTKCKKVFHYPCGLKAGSLHQFFGEFRSYCKNHRPKQKIDERVIEEVKNRNDMICYICYDDVNPHDMHDTLWAPCCKKNAWFHRTCVQQLAMSAGYFFKCPLCNNKTEFQRAMLDHGIFIPSQDASWELVPNAFEELLYRHNRCDAEDCLCPKGREHTSTNAKWELTLCRTCGSQGIHMACGQLKWIKPVWECTECTSILKKSVTSNSDSNPSAKLNQENILLCENNAMLVDEDTSDSDISVGTETMETSSSEFFPKIQAVESMSANQRLSEEHRTPTQEVNPPEPKRQRFSDEIQRQPGDSPDSEDDVMIISAPNRNETADHEGATNSHGENSTVEKKSLEPKVTEKNRESPSSTVGAKGFVEIDLSDNECAIPQISNVESAPNKTSAASSALGPPELNIMITNVTSLAPEVFDSVQEPKLDAKPEEIQLPARTSQPEQSSGGLRPQSPIVLDDEPLPVTQSANVATDKNNIFVPSTLVHDQFKIVRFDGRTSDYTGNQMNTVLYGITIAGTNQTLPLVLSTTDNSCSSTTSTLLCDLNKKIVVAKDSKADENGSQPRVNDTSALQTTSASPLLKSGRNPEKNVGPLEPARNSDKEVAEPATSSRKSVAAQELARKSDKKVAEPVRNSDKKVAPQEPARNSEKNVPSLEPARHFFKDVPTLGRNSVKNTAPIKLVRNFEKNPAQLRTARTPGKSRTNAEGSTAPEAKETFVQKSVSSSVPLKCVVGENTQGSTPVKSTAKCRYNKLNIVRSPITRSPKDGTTMKNPGPVSQGSPVVPNGSCGEAKTSVTIKEPQSKKTAFSDLRSPTKANNSGSNVQTNNGSRNKINVRILPPDSLSSLNANHLAQNGSVSSTPASTQPTPQKLNGSLSISKSRRGPIDKFNTKIANIPASITPETQLQSQKQTRPQGAMDQPQLYQLVRTDDKKASNAVCDGDAGTGPAAQPTSVNNSTNAEPNQHASENSCQRDSTHQAGEPSPPKRASDAGCDSDSDDATDSSASSDRSSSPDRTRLIYKRINLRDLKFSVCQSNAVKMTIYDTYSVNIELNSKTRGTRFSERRKSKRLATTREFEACDRTDSKNASERSVSPASVTDNEDFSSPSEGTLQDGSSRSAMANRANDSLNMDAASRTRDELKENLDPVPPSTNCFHNASTVADRRSKSRLRGSEKFSVRSINEKEDHPTISEKKIRFSHRQQDIACSDESNSQNVMLAHSVDNIPRYSAIRGLINDRNVMEDSEQMHVSKRKRNSATEENLSETRDVAGSTVTTESNHLVNDGENSILRWSWRYNSRSRKFHVNNIVDNQSRERGSAKPLSCKVSIDLKKIRATIASKLRHNGSVHMNSDRVPIDALPRSRSFDNVTTDEVEYSAARLQRSKSLEDLSSPTSRKDFNGALEYVKRGRKSRRRSYEKHDCVR